MSLKAPTIRGVAEIVIRVNDIDKTRPFYEETLGFQFVGQHPKVKPGILFLQVAELDTDLGQAGHHQFIALVDRNIHPGPRPVEPVDPDRTSLDHLAFEIPESEYDVWKRRFKDADIVIWEETFFRDTSSQAMFVSDPEGNAIELICHVRDS